MRLIGMMDSPYVRRTAISLRLMAIPFASERVSVFSHYETFASINPVVKAPTLVTADGVVLMDSSLILDYIERLLPPERRLTPSTVAEHARALRIIGLALAACEKTVQIVYERTLRPAEKQHQPWLDRVRGQVLSAYDLLERELGTGEDWLFDSRLSQPDITTAVAWRFTGDTIGDVVKAGSYPALSRFSKRAEGLPEFLAWPPD
jgi:glutathione S-transferase